MDTYCRVALRRPPVKYAKSGDLNIAYQVVGDGPFDLVYVPGFTSHLELNWEPPSLHVTERLASFSRLIYFDKRGTGMSDPVTGAPTLEERMDDVRAVMDAAGSEQAAFFGFSEGGAMALLFAATYPERTRALALWGAMARTTEAPDYPIAPPRDAFLESAAELILPALAEGTLAEIYVPSLAEDAEAIAGAQRREQLGASPGMVANIFVMYLDVDVRGVLGSVRAPTLILHAHGDRVVNVRHGRRLAARIAGARYVELPGSDHMVWWTDPDPVLDEVEEFLTGVRPVAEPDRVLATVMFTDIVGSTERDAEVGDKRWRGLLDAHHAATRRELERFRGREVKTTGDGFLATFDGPARAIRCGQAIVDALQAIGLDVRVGLHSGEIELIGDDVAGIAVNIASRVGALAAPGEVLVSETVKGLVAGSGLVFADRGDHELKGVPDHWRLFRVEP
jgi:pimeloyl-ACP methyl ester carboxylesterase